MTDKPFHELQAALVESQRHVNRAPMCSEEVEIVDEVKPSRWAMSASMGLIVGGIILSAALIVAAIVSARAAEPKGPRWVIFDTAAERQFHPHIFTSATACNMDIAHARDGSGKRLACVKIDQRRQ